MKCPNCNKEIANGAATCPHCGKPVAAGASTPAGASKAAGAKSMDGLAIASLVCSIVGMFFIPYLLPILGIIFGAVSMKRVEKRSTSYKIAVAGLIVGIIGLVIQIIVLVTIGTIGIASMG